MPLIDTIRSMKSQGFTLDEVYSQLQSPKPPYWLVRVLYNIA